MTALSLIAPISTKPTRWRSPGGAIASGQANKADRRRLCSDDLGRCERPTTTKRPPAGCRGPAKIGDDYRAFAIFWSGLVCSFDSFLVALV